MEADRKIVFASAGLAALALAVRPAGFKPAGPPARIVLQEEETKVIFDVRTGLYHCRSCVRAILCASHCVPMTLADAVEKGGAPSARCCPRAASVAAAPRRRG